MRRDQKTNLLLFKISLKLAPILIAFALVGCPDSLEKWNEDKQAAAITDSTSGGTTNERGTNVVATDMLLEELTIATLGQDDLTYSLHKAADSDPQMRCAVPEINGGTITASEDVVCWLDVEERDLFHFGTRLALYLRPQVCDYLGFRPPSFWQYKPGRTDPTKASARIQVIGSIDEDCSTLAKTTYPDMIDPENMPKMCNYDYSDREPPGPNCDTGAYHVTTVNFAEEDGTGCVDMSVEGDVKCEGVYQSCYGGTGAESDYLDSKGWPTELIYKTYDEGFDNSTDPWIFEAPTEKGFYTNRYITNYFRMCTDQPTLPHPHTYRTSTNDNSCLYMFMQEPPLPTEPDSPLGPWRHLDVASKARVHPYYSFTCYDHAFDVRGRIRLIVREWDREFDITNSYVTKGYPDFGDSMTKLHDAGATPGSDESDNTGGNTYMQDLGAWNDYLDWDDTTPYKDKVSNIADFYNYCQKGAGPSVGIEIFDYPEGGL
jgi:hypothetical protein